MMAKSASKRGDEASTKSATVKPEVVQLVGEEPTSIGRTHHMRMPIQISSDEDERISNQVLDHELCSSKRITCISVVKGSYCKLIKEKYHPLNHKPGTRVLTDKEHFKFCCRNK